MTVEPIGLIALLVGMIGLFVEQSFIVYAFFASTLLGAAAALILNSLGGATIQPAHLLLGFLTVKLLASRNVRAGALRAVAVGSPGFWLLVTAGYAAMTAYLLPRFFQGQTFAFTVRAQGENYAAPLAPSTSNLTQSVYFIGDCICFLALSGFGSSEGGRKCLGRAALMCVILNLGFAVLDIATYATNTGELLSFIRNSTYSIMSDTEIAGFKRVVGSFVEASSFGYWTLGYFAFATSLWLSGIAMRLTLVLSVLSFLALLFSTSTTAYVGMSGYLFVEFVIVAVNFLFGRVRPQMLIFLICVPIGLALVVVAICINDASYAYVANLLDELVLNKMSTGSGIERSTWNNQAIQNFLDTFGFGVGNGSVRASSFPVAVIASLGFLGAATYASFLLTIWFRKAKPVPPTISATQRAGRSACLAWLIAASASGSFIDLGLPFFAFAALACAECVGVRTRSASAMRTELLYRRDVSTALD
jgi:O-Antigen ligase